jgi:hypothetical protein
LAAGIAVGVPSVFSASTRSPEALLHLGLQREAGGFQIVTRTAGQIPGSGSSSACFPILTVTKSTSTPIVPAGGTAT